MTAVSHSIAAQERVLVPLAVGVASTPGGYGSIWKSELYGFNRGTTPLVVTTSASLCMLGSCPVGRFTIPPGEALKIISAEPTMMFVLVGDPRDLSLNARVFDESRNRVDWGTELPIVASESFQPGFTLINVPVRSGFRVLLRLYEADGGADTNVTIRIRDAATNAVVRELPLTLEARYYDLGFDFGYGQWLLDDVLGAGTEGLVHIELTPTNPVRRFWGFVSITHNETQHVTLVTPQPARF